MKFRFTRHALERLRQRGIKVRDVKNVLLSPASRIKVLDYGAIEAKKKVRGKNLVVIFETKRTLRKIITVYFED